MSLGETIEGLISSGYSFRVRGFFNVEGGQVGLSNMFHEWCDCMSLRPGPTEDCDSCTRKDGNYISLAAGDGDGIYVVAEILDSSHDDEVVGAIAVFDNQYRMANSVRAAIEAETVPKYPIDLALIYADARPLALGSLNNTGLVLIADSGSGLNPRDAIVDVHIAPEKTLSVFGFVETVSTDPEEWVERLCLAQGQEPETTARAMVRGLAEGKSIFESLGFDHPYSLPPIIPRALVILDHDSSKSVNLDDSYLVDDWELLGAQFAGSVGTSHAKGMSISTVWMNALLAIEWDRVAGENLDLEETKRLLFDSWTWAYQGIMLDDDDCRNIISSNQYRATPEEVADLLRRRGHFEAAKKALAGEMPELGLDKPSEEPSSGTTTGSGLTKSSNGVGLRSTPSAVKSAGLAKFCTQCGTAFAIENAMFCTQCGSIRA